MRTMLSFAKGGCTILGTDDGHRTTLLAGDREFVALRCPTTRRSMGADGMGHYSGGRTSIRVFRLVGPDLEGYDRELYGRVVHAEEILSWPARRRPEDGEP